jgi:predicted component of type VI protein secretion system
MISRLISVQDASRSVSKTHLHLRVSGEGLWVSDRNSTNGSAITSPGSARTQLLGGKPALAEIGSTVHFGDRSFVVGRA